MKDTSKRALRNLPPKSHLEAIGATAAQWARVESVMELMICGLYEINADRGLVLTSNLSLNSRLDLLRILANNAVDDKLIRERFVAAVNRIADVYGERNKMVHGIWKRTDKPGVARRLTLRARGKRVVGNIDDLSAAAIWGIFETATDLVLDLSVLADDLGVESKMEAAPKHSKAPRA
jgi:hypothetical protein